MASTFIAGPRSSDESTPSIAESAPHAHAVEFYESDDYLAQSVGAYLAEGLVSGDAVIVVATPEHQQLFTSAVADAGVDLDAAGRDGRFMTQPADILLAEFLVDGQPDGDKFRAAVGTLIEKAGAGGRPVRVYGEMVAVLWAGGEVTAALALEDLWNDLARTHTFDLLCAYPLHVFDNEGGERFHTMCRQHSSVVPTESYTALPDADRDRAVVALQQEASAGAAATEALKLEHALQINDDIMQGLFIAQMALDLGDAERARDAVARTIEMAQNMVNARLDQLHSEGELYPGFARRTSTA